MTSLKFLKNAAALFAALLSILAAPQAEAVSAEGHISASVVGALNITELFPIKFGNFEIICTNNMCDAASSIVLSDQGIRTAHSSGSDTIALLSGGGGGLETGSQSPGFYRVDTAGETPGSQNVYVSFADQNGSLIDTNHPANHVFLSGPVPNAFTVDTFTFEGDTGTTGYQQLSPSATDTYGTYVPLGNDGTVTIRIGATLHTAAGITPPPGQYTGTFNVLVSY